ncbi:MAG: phosphotransferase [SAR202 cluster bacterium]|jgi:hypothetical protein|nr:phosphotransferase [SAR202 cluster bacterium]
MKEPNQPALKIPERHEDVTADWLTQALRSGGVIGDEAIRKFRMEPLDANVSRTSSLARIGVEYDGEGDGLPHSMFAKFVSRIPENRAYSEAHGYFRREIELYKNFGDAIPLNMPRLYFGASTGNTDVAIVILEDIDAISKASFPLDKRSLSSGEATLALRELAKMHAKWWEDDTLCDYGWLNSVDGSDRMLLYQSYEEGWSRIRDVLGPRLTPDAARICEGLSDYLPTLLSELESIPATLCHGDCHYGNLLWDEIGNPSKVWVIDWQMTALAPAVLDVSWLMAFGIAPDDLPFVRRDYLPEYHRALANCGVTDYGYEQFLNDYRFGILDGLARLTAFLSRVDFAEGNPIEFASLRVGTVAAAAEDAGCADLIR